MLGEFFALGAALSFAVGNTAVAKAAQSSRGDKGALLSIVLTALLSGVLWLTLPADAAENLPTAAFWHGALWFMGAGILATIFGRMALFRSISYAGAINASLFRRMIPLFATILAFAVLGETLSPLAGLGMAAILTSIVLVFAESKSAGASRAASAVLPRSLRTGQVYGLASALFYGAAFVTRKLGLQDLPDATLGTLISGMTALACYLLVAVFNERNRSTVVNLVRDTGRWQLVAAAAMSIGQIAQFFALKHAEVAVVAIVGSVEIFIAAYLAVFLFRTETMPRLGVMIATIIATAGVIMVAFG